VSLAGRSRLAKQQRCDALPLGLGTAGSAAGATLTAGYTAGWLAGACLLVPATHASVRCSAVGWLLVDMEPLLSFSAVQYLDEGSVPVPLPRRGIVLTGTSVRCHW
jgi:hypothetical protein